MAALLEALLAVQAEVPTLPKDATNPHFKSKFTPLDTIVEYVGPILNKHGLVWSSWPTVNESGDPALRYKLAHAESGEALEDTMSLLLVKSDPQGQGSAITYARRYALCAVLNLVADEDDDDNAGSSAPRQSKAKPKPAVTPPTPGTIDESTVKDLARLYKASGWREAEAEDPHATLRMQLTMVGADNQGDNIPALIKKLTAAQAETLKKALEEGTQA